MRKIIFYLLISFIVLPACSSSSDPYAVRSSRHRQYVIYEEEIQTSGAMNVMDLVTNLRPSWLRGRGINAMRNDLESFPLVYVNGSRYGYIDTLYDLPVQNILEIRLLSAGTASGALGISHNAGAIVVTYFRD